MMRIGPHHVCCASIDSREVDRMLAGVEVEILYTNPPWGPDGMRNWNDYRTRNTGKPTPEISYDSMLDRVAQLAARARYAFVEMRADWSHAVAERLYPHFACVAVHAIKARNPDAYDVVAAGPRLFPGELRGKFQDGLGDLAIPDTVIGAVGKPGAIVLDPLCGYGLVAHAALKYGMVFYGNEFNEARLYHAIRFLERSTRDEGINLEKEDGE